MFILISPKKLLIFFFEKKKFDFNDCLKITNILFIFTKQLYEFISYEFHKMASCSLNDTKKLSYTHQQFYYICWQEGQ